MNQACDRRQKNDNDDNALDQGRENHHILESFDDVNTVSTDIGKSDNREKRETSLRHLNC